MLHRDSKMRPSSLSLSYSNVIFDVIFPWLQIPTRNFCCDVILAPPSKKKKQKKKKQKKIQTSFSVGYLAGFSVYFVRRIVGCNHVGCCLQSSQFCTGYYGATDMEQARTDVALGCVDDFYHALFKIYQAEGDDAKVRRRQYDVIRQDSI